MFSKFRAISRSVILAGALLSLVGCSFFDVSEPLQDNTINFQTIDGTSFDRLLLDTLFPKGLATTISDSDDEARALTARSLYRESRYTDSIGTPAASYGYATSTVRIPASGYLTATHPDPTEKGRYLTLEKVSESAYRVAFIIEKEEISSLDSVVTTYYVGADSWDAFRTADLEEPGWATERVYYRYQKVIGDRTMIAEFFGPEVKHAFVKPDYTPFDPEENKLGHDAIFTINIDRLYREDSNNDLDYYFNRFWDASLVGLPPNPYSSFIRTLVFDAEKAEDPGFAFSYADALSEQNDYYTEVTVDQYPSILHIPDGTLGHVKAGITYFLNNDTNAPLEIVNSNSIYQDINDKFLMKDVKVLTYAQKASDYPHIYRHYYLYERSGRLTFQNDHYYYKNGNITNLREAGLGSHDRSTSITLTKDHDGSWAGSMVSTHRELLGDTEITMKARLVDGYLQYSGMFNGILFEITPDSQGNVSMDLPGGGRFEGRVSSSGTLEGVYYPVTGDPVSL